MTITTTLRSIWEGIKRMLGIKDYKSIAGKDIAITAELSERIALWRSMYNGSAPWTDKYTSSLRLEQGIAREFADVVLNEMEIHVSSETLDEYLVQAMRDLNENLQEGLALGAFCIKPLGHEGEVEFIMQGDFIPIQFDSRGRLTDVIFIDVRRQGDTNYYRRFERHTVSENKLQITQSAYRGTESHIGLQIPLDTFEDWGKLKPATEYEWNKPDFGYFRTPVKNVIDRTPNGVSIYDTAVGLLKATDRQFGRLDWEYESAERAIIADETAIPKKGTPGDRQKPKERLLRTLDISSPSELYKEFSPAMRDSSYIAGLSEYKRQIEFAVGLSYGDLSNIQDVEKTATEIKAAKKRKYNRVKAIQDNLSDCLQDLVDAIAFYTGLSTTGYEVLIDFADSILTDEETERDQLRRDLASGVLQPWEYRVKVYHEDEETAKSMVPMAPDVLADTGRFSPPRTQSFGDQLTE